MALYNFGDLLTQTYRYFYIDYTQVDDTAIIPVTLMKQFINDGIREISAGFGTKWKYKEGSLPFMHVLNYQNLYLSGTNTTGGTGVSISGTLNAPEFIQVNSNPANYLMNYPNYSGIAFSGLNGSTPASGISVGGYVTTTQWTGVGYTYELPPDVSHIEGVFIDNQGFLNNGLYQRRLMSLPQSIWHTTGIPGTYYEQPGMSLNGNLQITFDPQPTPSITGTNPNFLYLYENKQLDLVNDNDVQNVIPEEFQRCIIYAALEMAYGFRQNAMADVFKQKKQDVVWEMIRSSERYTNYTVSWFPGDLAAGWTTLPYSPAGWTRSGS